MSPAETLKNYFFQLREWLAAISYHFLLKKLICFGFSLKKSQNYMNFLINAYRKPQDPLYYYEKLRFQCWKNSNTFFHPSRDQFQRFFHSILCFFHPKVTSETPLDFCEISPKLLGPLWGLPKLLRSASRNLFYGLPSISWHSSLKNKWFYVFFNKFSQKNMNFHDFIYFLTFFFEFQMILLFVIKDPPYYYEK